MKMKEYVEGITVNGISILNILEESGVEESMEIKWLRVLFGLKVRVDHSFGPLTICPQIEKIRYTSISNKAKVFTTVASTMSRSSFKMGDMRGVLEHCRGEIMSLHTNYTSFSDLIALLQVLGSYIGWAHEKTTGNTIELCRKQVAEMVRKAPHKILNVKTEDIKKLYNCTNKSEVTVGSMKVTQNTEYLSREKTTFNLDKGMNMVHSEGLLINLEVRGATLKPLSEEFKNVPDIFLEYLNLKDALKNRIKFYLNHMPEMLEAIEMNDFRWFNVFIGKFLGPNKETISYSCRSAIKACMELSPRPTVLMAFLYCMCFPEASPNSQLTNTFTLNTGHLFSIDAKTGMFLYDDSQFSYRLFGEVVGDPEIADNRERFIRGLLHGYRVITHDTDEIIPYRTVRYLRNKRERIVDGTKYLTNFGGEILVIRDAQVGYSVMSTENRQIQELVGNLQKRAREDLKSKLKEIRQEVYEDEPGAKKRVVEEETEEISLEEGYGCGVVRDDDYDFEDL